MRRCSALARCILHTQRILRRIRAPSLSSREYASLSVASRSAHSAPHRVHHGVVPWLLRVRSNSFRIVGEQHDVRIQFRDGFDGSEPRICNRRKRARSVGCVRGERRVSAGDTESRLRLSVLHRRDAKRKPLRCHCPSHADDAGVHTRITFEGGAGTAASPAPSRSIGRSVPGRLAS